MDKFVWIYRSLYVLVLVVFLANGINRSPQDFGGEMVGVGLFLVSCLLLFGTVLMTGVRHRSSNGFIWAITLVWCFLFSWFAWLSPSSPFVIHEAHSLDAVQAEAEAGRYNAAAVAIFVLLLIWFLSFPFVQRYASGHRAKTGGRRGATSGCSLYGWFRPHAP